MAITAKQARGHASGAAKARQRVERVRQYSAHGYTKQEAAAAMNMSEKTFDLFLWRHEGTQAWPIV
jgi:predicted DNA-binding protein (UPF0251 family)